jgi:hypothetical protein
VPSHKFGLSRLAVKSGWLDEQTQPELVFRGLRIIVYIHMKPIKEAPKDGTLIKAVSIPFMNGQRITVLVRWDAIKAVWEGDGAEYDEATLEAWSEL